MRIIYINTNQLGTSMIAVSTVTQVSGTALYPSDTYIQENELDIESQAMLAVHKAIFSNKYRGTGRKV
jgi:hypothetical protein